jgi:hypothetical protein
MDDLLQPNPLPCLNLFLCRSQDYVVGQVIQGSQLAVLPQSPGRKGRITFSQGQLIKFWESLKLRSHDLLVVYIINSRKVLWSNIRASKWSPFKNLSVVAMGRLGQPPDISSQNRTMKHRR